MKIIRNIAKRLEEALSTSRAVLLTGARQTGKTTIVENYAKTKEYTYTTFDDLSSLSIAKKDPKGFIEGLRKPAIIDEVQRVPSIFLPIKRDVDINQEPGRYLLTGSANPLLINKVGESLAGRLETLVLFPLSQGELRGHKEDFIKAAYSSENIPARQEKLSKEELYQLMTVGGYPSVQNLPESRRLAWFKSYVNDILLRDAQDLANIERLSELPDLLKMVAFRAGHIVNAADLSRLLGISAATMHRYLTLLETLYMIHFCQPWRASAEKRLVKSPKAYLIDTGILTYLQGITVERMLAEPVFTGHVLENFVWAELSKQATWSDIQVGIYHFRTSTGTEVDIVLEDMMGRVVGIELKNSDTVLHHDFKGLEYLQEMLGDKFVRGVVLYTGNQHVPFGKKLVALPYSCLWQ
jgi:predicted AAA+ superfamily ATPase